MKLKAPLLALVLVASATTFAQQPAEPPLTPAGAPPPGFIWVPIIVAGVVVGFALSSGGGDDAIPPGGGTGTATGTR